MCGIAGYCTRGRNAESLQAALPIAVQTLKHRGPDDHGTWFAPGVGLGHSRLSILDLSLHGHQPMVTADKRYAMVFNGEVYNYREIREDLLKRGLTFAGSGDSEVVLAALATWGIEAVKRFIGMFAIALWDNQQRSLMLIRDRLGVKPLYYGWDGETFWFGSELKALRAFPHWQPEIDRTALGDYFQFGYVNAPLSIYKSVKKVQPGHWVRLSQMNDGPQEQCYWSVLDAIQTPLQGDEAELEEELETLLVDAFNLRMVSDVPVGVFLSGGIDSSLLAALLQKKRRNDPIHTFTIGFNVEKYNEAPHARRVAEHLGTNHTERILETDEAQRILPSWGNLFDEPFADSSGIPTYLVSKIAGEQVKVVLSADGGDELFSGYNNYTNVLRLLHLREKYPSTLRGPTIAALKLMPLDAMDRLILTSPMSRGVQDWLRHKFIRRARLARDTYLNDFSPGVLYEMTMSPYWRGHALGQLTRHENDTRFRHLCDIYPGSLSEQMCLWDLHNYLPGDILTKVDRATMAASIEGREPLIDHRLVEFAFRLPLNMRRGTLGPKHLLRKILFKYIPRELIERPKMGFAIPLLEWLRGDLSYLVDDLLDINAIKDQGILDPHVVETVVGAFRSGDGEVANKVWALIAFQSWYNAWML